MSRKKITQFYDDLDGTELSEDQLRVVRFGVDGKDYLLDLSPENEKRFFDALEPFLKVASPAAAAEKSDKVNPRDVRAWAAKTGRTVASRGKIPNEIIQAYRDANGRR
ncbi:histone-like nucleoid-structuring protein Lsr2 [Corynebacterium tapiri]|uniref:Lsr2 family protein n=1 Tax=Corynebacterium tapiri TaxID=1448266 RepID=A0A5C4U2D9_9CORY|nr:Lsr2 family protein [Corynebacterium tapiri]TNL94641.1 Lsr2 family protein [Corynebacterium tapiri]